MIPNGSQTIRRLPFRLVPLAVVFFIATAVPTIVNAQSLPPECATFTDDPVIAQETVVKAVHFTELRGCVNALRLQALLSASTWTDPSITPGVTEVRAVHLSELRDALNGVYSEAGVAVPQYTDGTLEPGVTSIKALHIVELRSAARALNLPQASSPEVLPSAGTYSVEPTVTMSTTTSGGTIRYTLDGSMPTASSTPYTGPFLVTSSATVRARTFRAGYWPSALSSGTYTLQVAAPAFSPPAGTYTGQQQITIQSASPGVSVYYTTNGSDPTPATGALYSGPITLSPQNTVTLNARGYRSGWSDSSIITGVYTLNFFTAPTPTMSPAAGTYDIGQQVTLAVSPGFTILYTVDGSEPTDTSTLYSGPLTLNEPTTVKAKAFGAGYTPSATAAANFAIRLPKPSITPVTGVYSFPVSVTTSTTATGATIRYTVDRTEPTESSEPYTGNFVVVTTPNTTVKTRAFKTGWAPSNVATETYNDGALPPTSGGTVSVAGASPTTFAQVNGSVQFNVSGATISTSPGDVRVYRNGAPLNPSSYQVFSTSVQIPSVLLSGENTIELEALDDDETIVRDVVVLWAGSRSVLFTVRDRDGSAIADATVTASLRAAGDVTASGTTSGSGQLTLSRLPANEVLEVVATAEGYRPHAITVSGQDTSASITLDRDNNDFNQGLDGWNGSPSVAYIVDHSESTPPWVPCPGCPIRSSSVASSTSAETASTDQDLRVNTQNFFGAQTVTRTFSVPPGTGQVSVRYRFASDEVFNAYPNYRNDSYTVSLASTATSQTVSDNKTVAVLLANNAFDANAGTPWYTLTLPTSDEGDIVTATFTVANAIDNAHMSYLDVDVVTERVVKIDKVSLFDLIEPNDPYAAFRLYKSLQGLSVSSHLSYGGYTRIHGTMRVTGPATDQITSIQLQVLEGGEVKLSGDYLARSEVSTVRATLLNQQFGASGRSVGLNASGAPLPITPVLFEIPSAALQNAINQDTNGNVELRIVVQTANGLTVPFDVPNRFPKLTLYTVTPRDGANRDEGLCSDLTAQNLNPNKWKGHPFPCGGDGWALPAVRQWAEGVQAVNDVRWNDFSNMHAGSFPYHSGHRNGDIIDGKYDGYLHLDDSAANKLIAILNMYGRQVDRVLVGFGPSVRSKYQNVRLTDGRCARDVIKFAKGHTDHFDIRFFPSNPLPTGTVGVCQ